MNLYQLHTNPKKLYGWDRRHKLPSVAYKLAFAKFVQTRERDSELEDSILQDGEWAYRYARDVIGGRWPEGEPAIAQDLSKSYLYTAFVLKRSSAELGKPEAEEIIKNSNDTYGHLYRSRFDIASYDTP